MPTLVRAPEELEARVREAAKAEGVSINSWWIEAAEARIDATDVSIRDAARILNADPVTRYVLDRLAE